MRLLVVGATGILGRALVIDGGRRGWEVHGTYHERPPEGDELAGVSLAPLAAHDLEQVRQLMSRVRPQVVINAAGLTRARCLDVREAWLANAYAPRILGACAQARDARIVHVSTDCVFSGDRGLYEEDDRPDATDLYGRSKASGELRAPALTVRTSFVGREVGSANGLLAWFLSRSDTVPGWGNHRWNGLAAPCLARLLLDLAEREDVTGVLHLHGEDTTKAGLLELLARVTERPVRIEMVDAPVAIDRRLRSQRLAGLGIAVPRLEDQLKELARTLRPIQEERA